MKFLHFWREKSDCRETSSTPRKFFMKENPSEKRTVLFSEGFHLMSVLIHPNPFIPDTFPQTAFSTAYITSHSAAYFFR